MHLVPLAIICYCIFTQIITRSTVRKRAPIGVQTIVKPLSSFELKLSDIFLQFSLEYFYKLRSGVAPAFFVLIRAGIRKKHMKQKWRNHFRLPELWDVLHQDEGRIHVLHVETRYKTGFNLKFTNVMVLVRFRQHCAKQIKNSGEMYRKTILLHAFSK